MTKRLVWIPKVGRTRCATRNRLKVILLFPLILTLHLLPLAPLTLQVSFAFLVLNLTLVFNIYREPNPQLKVKIKWGTETEP